jgi:hypothetical protein
MITGLVPVPLPHQFPPRTQAIYAIPELATALPPVTVLNNARRATTAFEVSGNPAPLTK